jgi:hypothetical protein
MSDGFADAGNAIGSLTWQFRIIFDWKVCNESDSQRHIASSQGVADIGMITGSI